MVPPMMPEGGDSRHLSMRRRPQRTLSPQVIAHGCLLKVVELSPTPARRTAHMMLIARAITRIAVTSEITDSAIMAIFGQVRTGRVSVGLNAVAFVNER